MSIFIVEAGRIHCFSLYWYRMESAVRSYTWIPTVVVLNILLLSRLSNRAHTLLGHTSEGSIASVSVRRESAVISTVLSCKESTVVTSSSVTTCAITVKGISSRILQSILHMLLSLFMVVLSFLDFLKERLFVHGLYLCFMSGSIFNQQVVNQEPLAPDG